MKPTVYTLCLLLFFGSAFSQSSKQQSQIKPKWKLGDKKSVQSKSVSRIFLKDSLLNNTEATSAYTIEVIDTVKAYTLSYSDQPNSIDIETTSSVPKIDSAVNQFAGLIKKIEKETSAFKYELLVDKRNGQAYKVKNSNQYLNMIEKLVATVIDDLGERKAKGKAEIDSMKKRVVAYFKTMQPKVLETTLNEFNYLMQAYSYTFSYNATTSQKTMIHDVNALGEFGGTEMPAVLTITSKQQNNNLTIQTDTQYDKDFLLVELKKKRKNLKDVTTADIFLSERTKAVFTTKTNWIVSHKSNIEFKMKDVKVINETVVSFL